MAIEGYNVKLKKKEAMKDVVINRNGNRYFASGFGSDGTKMSAVMGEAKAKEALKNKDAKKGTGWE